jgi:hypothetical protein
MKFILKSELIMKVIVHIKRVFGSGYCVVPVIAVKTAFRVNLSMYYG